MTLGDGSARQKMSWVFHVCEVKYNVRRELGGGQSSNAAKDPRKIEKTVL